MQADGLAFLVILADGRVLHLGPKMTLTADDDSDALVVDREFNLLPTPAQDLVIRSAVFHAARNIFVWLQASRTSSVSPTSPSGNGPANQTVPTQKLLTRRLVVHVNSK